MFDKCIQAIISHKKKTFDFLLGCWENEITERKKKLNITKNAKNHLNWTRKLGGFHRFLLSQNTKNSWRSKKILPIAHIFSATKHPPTFNLKCITFPPRDIVSISMETESLESAICRLPLSLSSRFGFGFHGLYTNLRPSRGSVLHSSSHTFTYNRNF